MEERTAAIRQNLDTVIERVYTAAQSVNRDGERIRIVVVTKAQPVEVVQAAVMAGAKDLGENYPEETLPKIQAFADGENITWHMIGHLQSRKSAIVVEHFQVLHSLDSLRLAARLERQLSEQSRLLPVLMEFNVGGEESKYGWQAADDADWEKVIPEMEGVLNLPHLQVRGLMTMPPYNDNPELSRPYFSQLRRLGDFFAKRFGEDNFSEYSMGTSTDYEVAVQEGATFIRVGQAILGERPKKVIKNDIQK